MPTGQGSREPWTRREEIVVERFYDQGVDEVAALLPGRTVEAIRQRAIKLGVAAVTPAGLRTPCAGEDREAIIALHDQGMGYTAIARTLGLKEQAVSNAVLAHECERAGFTPAQRDAAGGLMQADVQRIYSLIRQGLPNVEIQRQMAVSASCASHYRRRLKKAGEAVPPTGKGLRYTGTRIPNDVRAQVEQHFMQGYGAAKVAQLAGVGHSFAKKYRNSLVARLAARGECLPGCDPTGRRIVVKQSATFITDQQKVDLQWLWLAGWPVQPAARHIGIGLSSAHRIIQDLKVQLVAEGKSFPRPLPPAQRPALDHAPTAKAPALQPQEGQRAPAAAFPAMHRPPLLLEPQAAPQTQSASPRPAPSPKRRLSFEEQLARVAAGAGLVATFKPTRPTIDATLGGVGSGLL